MKTLGLIFIFMFWSIMTLILLCSVIGWFVVLPRINSGQYVKTPEEVRSAWMWMGLDIKDLLIEKLK